MAEKLVFYATINGVNENIIEYIFHPGFSNSQVQKNILAIHCAMKDSNPLEVSSKGMQAVSAKYSAFNLKVDGYPLEVVFQGAKVFEDENGNEFGPFLSKFRNFLLKNQKLSFQNFLLKKDIILKNLLIKEKIGPCIRKHFFMIGCITEHLLKMEMLRV